MKVYVDELPKKCEDCPCCSGDQYCNYMWGNYTDTEKPHFDECNLKDYCKVPYDFNNNMTKYKEWLDNLPKNNNEQYKTCPLQSLADYTKKVRKEVLGELMNMLGDRAELIDCGGVAEFMFTTYDLTMCVKEILGEEKGETECQKN